MCWSLNLIDTKYSPVTEHKIEITKQNPTNELRLYRYEHESFQCEVTFWRSNRQTQQKRTRSRGVIIGRPLLLLSKIVPTACLPLTEEIDICRVSLRSFEYAKTREQSSVNSYNLN
jgi:hypothetical protein